MHKLLLTATLFALLGSISCRKEHNVDALENTTWHLKKLVDGHADKSVPSSIKITATFKDGQLTGRGGCNEYWANYTITGGQLSITLTGATEVGCHHDWEERYFAALSGSQSWGLDGNTLSVQCADAMLLFKK